MTASSCSDGVVHLEQARRLDAHQVDLRADRRSGLPEGHQVLQGGVDRHEVLTPRVAVGLDVGPEVALPALRTIDHVDRLLRETGGLLERVLDEVVDREEHAGVALRLDHLQGVTGGSGTLEQPCSDAALDEVVDVTDRAEVEGVVVRAPDGVDELANVRTHDLELGADPTEVAGRLDQPLTTDTEVGRTGKLHETLDRHVAEHELGNSSGERLCRGHRESQADLARRLVVDASHRSTILSMYGKVLLVPKPIIGLYYKNFNMSTTIA